MKKRICIVDADGIIYKCEEHAVDKINRENGTNFSIEDIVVYGKTGNDILDQKSKYYSDPSFVISQQPYEGAKQFMDELQKRCDVVVCTAVDPNCLTVRAAALQRDFGIRPDQIITASRKDLVVGDYFIDDCPGNIMANRSKYPILYRRPWNKSVSGVMSVPSYEVALAFIDYVSNPQPFTGIPEKGSIVCLVGPTGSGKTAITDEMLKCGYSTLKTYSTSQNPRYYHLSPEEFIRKQNSGFFAESTVYGGERYGISRESIDNTPEAANIVIPVDICGAISIKNIFGSKVTIAFCDVDKSTLISNIIRKDCPEKEKICRLENIDAEIANRQFCDIVIRNAEDLKTYIKKEETK